MTQIKDGSSKFGMNMVYNPSTKAWAGVVAKSLNDGNANFSSAGAIPVSFAVWDGGKLNRGGVKKLSGWTAVKFVGKSGGDDLIKELTTPSTGDAKAGKVAVDAQCIGCHTLSSSKKAPTPYTAPDLSNIGGYSTNAYLAESIKEPNAVIVPGYNRNAHKKSTPWYNVDAKTGKRVSTMPPMMTDDKQIANAVAYLKTLKVGVE
jgi:complex iron-sulfur molybdoenzyme family reductase subunit gamma